MAEEPTDAVDAVRQAECRRQIAEARHFLEEVEVVARAIAEALFLLPEPSAVRAGPWLIGVSGSSLSKQLLRTVEGELAAAGNFDTATGPPYVVEEVA